MTSSRFCSVTFSNHDINGRTGSDYIPTSSVNVSFPKENDNFPDGWDIAAIEEQEKTIHIDSISGKRYSMLKTMNDEGFFWDQAKHIPLRRETLAIYSIELELMLFINENFSAIQKDRMTAHSLHGLSNNQSSLEFFVEFRGFFIIMPME